MSSERIRYIDVAKGIVMLLVVFGHITSIPSFYPNSCNFYFSAVLWGQLILFAPFRMPAFFILHGFCSKHRRTVEEECKYAAKTLLLPMVLFMPFEGYGWFCLSMFFALVLYCIIRRIKWIGLQVGAVFLLAVVGVLLFNHGIDCNGLDKALVFLPFLLFGERCRKLLDSNTACLTGLIVYLVLTGAFCFLSVSMIQGAAYPFLEDCLVEGTLFPPFVTGSNMLKSPGMLPLYYLLGISGTLGVLLLSKLIGTCRPLEYVGRNSLLYYFLHIDIYVEIIRHTPLLSFINSLSGSAALSVISIFVLFLGVLAAATGLTYLVNRFVPWMTGKGL